jgi:hypothetical protein
MTTVLSKEERVPNRGWYNTGDRISAPRIPEEVNNVHTIVFLARKMAQYRCFHHSLRKFQPGGAALEAVTMTHTPREGALSFLSSAE